MIEREAIGNPAAAVMAGEREMHVAELLHRLHHGPRHRALGVGRMILVALGHIGPAIARQVGDDQRELVGELRRHAVPHAHGSAENPCSSISGGPLPPTRAKMRPDLVLIHSES